MTTEAKTKVKDKALAKVDVQPTEIMSAVQLKESEVAKIKKQEIKVDLKTYEGLLAELNVKGLEDVETYEKIKTIDLKIVKLRTGLDETHKKVKAPYLDITKAIDAAKNEMLSDISSVETISKNKRKVYEDLVKAEEARLAQIVIDRTNARLATLTSYGATLPIDDVTNMSDQLFAQHVEFLQKAAEEKAKADAEAKAIQDAKDLADKEKAEADAKALAASQETIAAANKALEDQKKAMEAMKWKLILSQATTMGYDALGGYTLSYKLKPILVNINDTEEDIIKKLETHIVNTKEVLLKEAASKQPAVLLEAELREIKKQVGYIVLTYNIPMTQPESLNAKNAIQLSLNEFKANAQKTLDQKLENLKV